MVRIGRAGELETDSVVWGEDFDIDTWQRSLPSHAVSVDSSTRRTSTEIPFVDLERHHRRVAPELRRTVERVLEAGGFVLGDEVASFESEFATYCGVRRCVGVNSGTSALTLALIASGIGRGDEVIAPAHTYIATALGIIHAGATPVLCDVDDGTGLIDVDSAAERVSARTAAVVPVHLYGQVCDMEAVSRLANRHGLAVIEDAAQAHGAWHRGRRAGSFGTAAAFSFYPSKNLGALGDGGAVCTNDGQIADAVERLRNLGQVRKGEFVELGFNERLDELQAALLRVKLRALDRGNALRRACAASYRELLPRGARRLSEDPRGECVYHLFPVRLSDRDAAQGHLQRRGIGSGIHYWPALHRQPALESAVVSGQGLDRAAQWSEEELSLPMFAELSADEIAAVANAVADAIAGVDE